jgi:hypothetical protein
MECRQLAALTDNAEHKALLSKMATTWEGLAVEREAHLERQKRIAALETSPLPPAK